jgi:hypothetical protein
LEKAAELAGRPVSELSLEEMWAVFFRYARERERRELVNELMRAEEGIGMAGEMLLTISRDEAERARQKAGRRARRKKRPGPIGKSLSPPGK